MAERTHDATHPDVHAGFVPLTDCAPLAIAKELGFDHAEGFNLVLHRQMSWAAMRDKLEAGLFDCAIMLAPLPFASTLGLGGRSPVPCVAVMATSLNGNAITVSNELHQAMLAADEAATNSGGMNAAKALKKVVLQRHASDQEPLTLGIVYPFSCHNYDLRYWLAAAGIDPDLDVNLVVIPPPLIAGSLQSGRIDGFCVGEPWNSVAVSAGDGVIVTTKRDLWNGSPEKVLSVRQSFLTAEPVLVAKIVRALERACAWLDDTANRKQAATWLASSTYVGIAEELIEHALLDKIGATARSTTRADTHSNTAIIFHRDSANTPSISHAIWLLTQMIRAGQAPNGFNIEDMAQRVYRPDVFAAAMTNTTTGNGTVEMSSGAFFDTVAFDPKAPLAYLRKLPLLSPALDLSRYS